MLVKVLSSSFFGIEPFLVEVEVDTANGLPIFNIVGLGDTIIIESRERIRAAIKNMGYILEPKRIIVNLTPANIKKYGSHFDLPIAIGIMKGMKIIEDYDGKLEEYLFMGELSLTGEIRRVDGVISVVLLAKIKGFKGVIIPEGNFDEASIIKGVKIIPVSNLRDVVNFIETGKIRSRVIKNKSYEKEEKSLDMNDVKGQSIAKRALEISAAGGHNIIMVGTPGSGKSMLARRLITILPKMTEKEIIETTKIYSVSGELNEVSPIIMERPFRAPHHTTTVTAIIGGGRIPKPGEISLANNGVLFFDEYTEFDKNVIESLREPLEEKKVSITRSLGKVTFPAKLIFIAACNPCPCGNLFEEELCVCTPNDLRKYMKKLSGPVIDRIDLYVEIHRLKDEEVMGRKEEESSEVIRERVKKAREIQEKRYKKEKLNSEMTNKEIEKYCELDKESEKIMKDAIKKLKFSMRTYNKILKVSRTIADLEGKEKIGKEELLEAINYRK